MVESSAKVKPWRALVTAATVEAVEAAPDWHPGRLDPVMVVAIFTLARPASHYRTGKHSGELKETAPEHPVGRPDVDKLIRSTLDALTDSGAITDDARVTYVRAEKCFTGGHPRGHPDALDTPGAVLTLWAG